MSMPPKRTIPRGIAQYLIIVSMIFTDENRSRAQLRSAAWFGWICRSNRSRPRWSARGSCGSALRAEPNRTNQCAHKTQPTVPRRSQQTTDSATWPGINGVGASRVANRTNRRGPHSARRASRGSGGRFRSRPPLRPDPRPHSHPITDAITPSQAGATEPPQRQACGFGSAGAATAPSQGLGGPTPLAAS